MRLGMRERVYITVRCDRESEECKQPNCFETRRWGSSQNAIIGFSEERVQESISSGDPPCAVPMQALSEQVQSKINQLVVSGIQLLWCSRSTDIWLCSKTSLRRWKLWVDGFRWWRKWWRWDIGVVKMRGRRDDLGRTTRKRLDHTSSSGAWRRRVCSRHRGFLIQVRIDSYGKVSPGHLVMVNAGNVGRESSAWQRTILLHSLDKRKKKLALICYIPCSLAHFSIVFLPKTAASSINASTSSLAVNMGNLTAKIESKIVPADQISKACRE